MVVVLVRQEEEEEEEESLGRVGGNSRLTNIGPGQAASQWPDTQRRPIWATTHHTVHKHQYQPQPTLHPGHPPTDPRAAAAAAERNSKDGAAAISAVDPIRFLMQTEVAPKT